MLHRFPIGFAPHYYRYNWIHVLSPLSLNPAPEQDAYAFLTLPI